MNERCESCKFFKPDDIRYEHTGWGKCHRYPPTLWASHLNVNFDWIEVHKFSWCGEWKEKNDG